MTEFTKNFIFSMLRFLQKQKFGLEFTTKANRTTPDEFGNLRTTKIPDLFFGEKSSHRANIKQFAWRLSRAKEFWCKIALVVGRALLCADITSIFRNMKIFRIIRLNILLDQLRIIISGMGWIQIFLKFFNSRSKSWLVWKLYKFF